jgi:hypothetical protein
MINIKIEGLEQVQRKLAGFEKQIPFVLKNALNAVAFQTMREGREYLQKNIDRPTPWTVKSWYVRKKADKRDLVAVVGWSDYLSQKRIQEGQYAGAEFYLAQHWNGGQRKLKAFERQLIRKRVMPASMHAVPGDAAEELGMIDKYGNMKGSVLVAILSAVGAFDELGYSANATVRQSRRLGASKMAAKHVYWAGKPGKNTPNGIWMLDDKFSKRGRLRPVIVFVKPGNYRKRLDLDTISRTVEKRDLPREIDKAIDYAIRTAR